MSETYFYTLKNGMKVVYSPLNVNTVTCCLRGLAGSSYEKQEEIGAAHTLEHLVTYGSKSFPTSYELQNTVLKNGGRITATTSRDDVAFLTKTLTTNFTDGLVFLSEIFLKPLLFEIDLDNAKRTIFQEILQNVENPSKHIGRISYKNLFQNQRFTHFNTGSINQFYKLKLIHIINFYINPQR